MRTTVEINGKEYRLGFTPQTFVYFAKLMGLNQLSVLRDEMAIKELFESPTIEMMEAMFYAALKVGARMDGQPLDMDREQAAEAYLLEPGAMEAFNESMELSLSTTDEPSDEGPSKGKRKG